MHLSFLFTAAFASIAIAQSTSAVAQSPRGFMTVTPYSAHSPGYTPPYVDTATMPDFSGAPSNTSSWSSTKNYNSTHTATVTKSNYTLTRATMTPTSGSSGTVASTTTGPIIPISTTNTGTVGRVAGTSLALLAAGSLVSLLL